MAREKTRQISGETKGKSIAKTRSGAQARARAVVGRGAGNPPVGRLQALLAKPFLDLNEEEQRIVANYARAIGHDKRNHIPTSFTRQRVKDLIAFGHPRKAIAALIGCTEHALPELYADEIALGLEEANERVAKNILHEATSRVAKDRMRAAEFWMKNRAGWSDKQSHEVSGPGGEPMKHQIEVVLVQPKTIDGQFRIKQEGD